MWAVAGKVGHVRHVGVLDTEDGAPASARRWPPGGRSRAARGARRRGRRREAGQRRRRRFRFRAGTFGVSRQRQAGGGHLRLQGTERQPHQPGQGHAREGGGAARGSRAAGAGTGDRRGRRGTRRRPAWALGQAGPHGLPHRPAGAVPVPARLARRGGGRPGGAGEPARRLRAPVSGRPVAEPAVAGRHVALGGAPHRQQRGRLRGRAAPLGAGRGSGDGGAHGGCAARCGQSPPRA